jgi:DNA polymerase-3 subunit alpha
MADPRFIHLRLHTEYSLLEGAMRVKKLPGQVAKAGCRRACPPWR